MDKRNRILAMAAGAIFITAGVAYRVLSGGETVSPSEVISQVGDLTYYVKCEGCGQTYPVSAADFTRAAASAGAGAGIKCNKCGEYKASRVSEPTDDNPALAGFDKTQYGDIESVHAAVDELNEQLWALQEKMASNPDDPAMAEWRKEMHLLYLKREALDARADELTAAPEQPEG